MVQARRSPVPPASTDAAAGSEPRAGASAGASAGPTGAAAGAGVGTGTAQVRWGPNNPHPLSTMKTELVWEGKYDEWGNRRKVDAASLAMPMQKIETIDQPRSEAIASGKFALFEKQSKRVDDFRNRLIWGDNKLVMASLLEEFKGKIDLIYIDPPFDVGADFTMKVDLGETEAVFKDQSLLEMVAYKDMWGRQMNSYLSVMYERLILLRDLLSAHGSIYLHCDWHISGYLRCLMDDVFGEQNLLNEVVWSYALGGSTADRFQRKHDTIFFYAKQAGEHYFVQPQDAATSSLMAGQPKGARDVWRTSSEDEHKRILDAWQDDLVDHTVSNRDPERTGYPTQKPEAVIKRIVQASCPPNGVVVDVFAGSGTTAAVTERLGRRWIMADLGRFAIHTTRKRMIEVQRQLHAEGKPYRAFDLYNLGRYERQWWQRDALRGADEEHRRVVLEFFRAEMLVAGKASHPLIHGRKGRALCHVDGIDGIFTAAEAREVAKAAAAMGAKELCCLAWDFEMNIHQRLEAIRAEMGIDIRIYKIPREIMEKNRKGPPPWLEVAVLEAEPVYRVRVEKGGLAPVDIRLTRFLPSLAEVPTKELEAIRERAVKSGFDFIDFWAVDFEWSEDKPFNHHWQDYRTRKDRSLKTVSDAGHVYATKGEYMACVKVVDVFGCDTSITVKVRV